MEFVYYASFYIVQEKLNLQIGCINVFVHQEEQVLFYHYHM